jgi:apolipoprotein D and lipocalin family protein
MRAALLLVLVPALALALAGCVSHTPSTRQHFAPMRLAAVPPARLAGTWYEVARYPNPFEDGCTHATATYTPRADGSLGVVNRCRRGGGLVEIAGVAVPKGPGRLAVRLDGVTVAGDLRILGVSRDGRTVYVGTGLRTAGWVLHRDRHFGTEERRAAAQVFRANGYDEAALQRTDQR